MSFYGKARQRRCLSYTPRGFRINPQAHFDSVGSRLKKYRGTFVKHYTKLL